MAELPGAPPTQTDATPTTVDDVPRVEVYNKPATTTIVLEDIILALTLLAIIAMWLL